ncbi:uncharacterized protein DSM5745_04948 [Aspergillus mulundensis]|uniref:Transmembrane protein n=1 Tax=Aspergillus mulundensis TaxID=1810919 RepID=A0A3D8S5Q0_9EURO|nr:hypothetical protein DSM5745_04948 [Aspergillus mulundensis]RDW81391.1 hypothetical protein DSM5745_04948 [Aspergillus mulundensis]
MPALLYLSVSLVSRANTANADNVDDGTDHNGPSDKTTRIIVGVVVGGVAAIASASLLYLTYTPTRRVTYTLRGLERLMSVCCAVTAGIIFFFMKKRKWDRIRQCEERLIDYQLATGYSSKAHSRSATPEDYLSMMAQSPPPTSTTAPNMYAYDTSAGAVGQGHGQGHVQGQGQGQRSGSRARGMSAPASTTLSISTVSPEAPPPAYQSLHPRYDPSRYSQISTRFSSSFEIPRSSTGTFGTGSGAGPAGSASSVSGVQSYNLNPSLGTQYPQYQYQPGGTASASASGSGSVSNWLSSTTSVPTSTTGTTTTVSAGPNGTSTRGSRSRSESGERGPRRPRPVLSRLITNL